MTSNTGPAGFQPAPDGCIVAVTGSSGSGKTAWLKRQIDGCRRLLVWDIEGQYQGRAVTTITELARIIRAGRDERISYQARSLDEFDAWARIAFVYVQAGGMAGKQTTIVAEEIADVTSPAKAPQGWGMLIRRARKWGGNVYGVTQRAAESDKTLFGNAMILHCCALNRANDRAMIARELDIPVADVASLNWGRKEYLERDNRTGEITRGRLVF